MSRLLQFGDWTFDPDTNALGNGRSTVQLEPQVARLLAYFLAHQGEILGRERILRDVWNDRAVTDDAIQRCVGILRQTLMPDERQAFIRTITKKGYIATFPAPAGDASGGKPPVRAGAAWRPLPLVACAVIATVVFAFALAFVLDWDGLRERLIPPEPADATESPATPAVTSIAVLPFADMSPEQDQVYFAEGVAEEILNLLARTPRLRVIARTSSFSFGDRNASIETIAGTLHVTHVLEGSVRRSGNRVRIAVQLVDAGNSAQVWSDTYDRELGDVLALQTEIASSVAEALQVSLGLAAGTRPAGGSIDPEAFDLYLRGLREIRTWTYSSLIDAETSFEASTRLAPDFARAWYGLGLALLLQVIHEVAPLERNLPKMREVIERGQRLAPDHAGFLALRGQVARYDREFDLAESYLARAIALDPSDTWVRNLYCFYQQDLGRPEEALKIQQRTLEIDPLNPAVYVPIGFSHLDLWHDEEALAAARRFQQLSEPGNLTALGMNAIMKLVLEGDYAGTIVDRAPDLVTLTSPERMWEAADVAISYYTIEDTTNGDAWARKVVDNATGADAWVIEAMEAYATMVAGDVRPFRAMRTAAILGGHDDIRLREYDLYLLADELIGRGEAQRALDLMLEVAPEWRGFKEQPDLPAEAFYPASALVKSGYSSWPAAHFVPFIRVLRAVGDEAGAANMLHHLETILASRRDRGLFIERVYEAEAQVLRGNAKAALEALEAAERERTIYFVWQLRVLHNGTFDPIRNEPRYAALIERIRAEMRRQRGEVDTWLAASGPTG